MPKIKFHKLDGREFEQLNGRLTFAEVDELEKLIGTTQANWSDSTATRVVLYVSIKRSTGGLVTWQQTGEWTIDDYDVVDENPDPASDSEGQDENPPSEGGDQNGNPAPSSGMPEMNDSSN